MWGSPDHLRICGGVLVAQVEVRAVDEHVINQLEGEEVVVTLPLWSIYLRVFKFLGHYRPLPFIVHYPDIPFKNCKEQNCGVGP